MPGTVAQWPPGAWQCFSAPNETTFASAWMSCQMRMAAFRWYSNFLWQRKNEMVMGKDREGKFHPRKGKPSGAKTENTGLKDMSSSAYEENINIVDKYTVGDEEPAPNLHVRHRNRNPDKREERQQERSNMKNTKAKRETLKKAVADVPPAEEIPAVLTKEMFAELASYQSECCVSAFLPTHPSGVEVNELVDNTSFKTLLQHLGAMLKQKNIDQIVIDKMLKPGYDLLRNDVFWRSMSPGLAVFIADGVFKFMRMPMTPKEEILINTSFYLSPLIPIIVNSDYFYLLVLSKKQAKFYRANAFGMVQLIIDEMPKGVDDVVHFEEKDDQKLWRTDTGGAGGGANYHGMGAGKPDDKANLAMYFDEVDETLWKAVLNRENVPLLLAGVEYLIPIYKSVAQYKPIWDDAITGSQEHEDINTLYELARKKMEPYFRERHAKALEAYGNSSATGLTSSIPADVIPAAHYKRVWHLFVQKDEHIWGTFDEMNNKLTLHETQQEGDECLLDKAVIRTILNAGEVHVLPRDQMPADSKIAALMRYEI